ncbi:MAG: hypothetical protein IIY60_04645, partial [Clostridia bacterium]|nr:hypothetical protein [Clostridia bacterium]
EIRAFMRKGIYFGRLVIAFSVLSMVAKATIKRSALFFSFPSALPNAREAEETCTGEKNTGSAQRRNR